MEKQENFFTESRELFQKYVEDRLLLIKLQVVEKISGVAAMIFAGVVMILLSFFILLFVSLTACYFFASLTGSLYLGFGIVTAFYLLLLLVILAVRKKLIKKIAGIFIKTLLSETKYDDNESISTKPE
jgi:hypothetical protein